jgi:hypothetical protein
MKNNSTLIIIAAISILVICICGLCIIAVASIITLSDSSPISLPTIEIAQIHNTPTPHVVRPYSQVEGNLNTPTQTPPKVLKTTPTITPTPASEQITSGGGRFDALTVPTDTVNILENAIIPINDLTDLVSRLEGKHDIPTTVSLPSVPYQVGSRESFWVTDVDTNQNAQIDAILSYATEHAYFWIEDGVRYDEVELRDLAETFEHEIYPTVQEFFGSEWTPGVDNDPHIYILYASDLGYNLAGYFSSSDEYHPLVHEYSNAHEMFLFNADNVGLAELFTYGVLAHEYQHMIHWYQDRNESSWLQEGFSELAAFLSGYYDGGFDWLYTTDPDIQLNDWPANSSETTPHYGASFLFVNYFLNRFGENATKALVAHPENGLSSIDAVLTDIAAVDPLTNDPIDADDLFLDWVIATYLNDGSVGDGRFTYDNYPNAPQLKRFENFYNCPIELTTREVHQYGVDYIQFTCEGDYTLNFEGSIEVGVLPADPFSGSYAYWSNRGDESDMTLTRTFDFSDHDEPLTLTYWTWYDIERDYDYLYLLASLDGKKWDMLNTPAGTMLDPTGNNFGWAYNGVSGDDGNPRWIQEQVDLSQFAGQEVQIRLEYVTDAAVNGEGFLLDDVAIPETGYFEDFENDDEGWEAAGWVRIQNILPQNFRLALITFGDTTSVEYIPLEADVSAEIPIHIGGAVDEVVLVISGTTRYTRQTAPYRFSVEPE